MKYPKSCDYSIRLIEKLNSLDKKKALDLKLINKAICWAKKYHADQKRKSGELYYTHPLEVAYMISDHNLKTDVIVASILHDIIEDTEVTAEMIEEDFSYRIAQMVDRLTRERCNGSKLSVKEILDNAYQHNDKEVLLIKLFDRIHNLDTLNAMVWQKQIHTKLETIDLFPFLCVFLDSVDFDRLLTDNLSGNPAKNSSTSLVDEFYRKSGASCLMSNKFFEIVKS